MSVNKLSLVTKVFSHTIDVIVNELRDDNPQEDKSVAFSTILLKEAERYLKATVRDQIVSGLYENLIGSVIGWKLVLCYWPPSQSHMCICAEW